MFNIGRQAVFLKIIFSSKEENRVHILLDNLEWILPSQHFPELVIEGLT